MPEAARLNDPVTHTEEHLGLLIGLAIGAAICLAVIFAPELVLAAVFVAANSAVVGLEAIGAEAVADFVADRAAGFIVDTLLESTESTVARAVVTNTARTVVGAGTGARAGQFVGKLVHINTGILTGSPDVWINKRNAARHLKDTALCPRHSPPPIFLAQGSGTVFVNGENAVRKGDSCNCGAFVSDGSEDVIIGGEKAGTPDSKIPKEVSPELDFAVTVAGMGSDLVLKGWGKLSEILWKEAIKKSADQGGDKFGEYLSGDHSRGASIFGETSEIVAGVVFKAFTHGD